MAGFSDKVAQRTMQGKTLMYQELEKIASLSTVYGYQTSVCRKSLSLPKTHDIDALCVATLYIGEVITHSRENFYLIKFRPGQTHRQYHDLPRKCPAYIPSVGDIDGDGRDEVNGGYFVLNSDGHPLWEKRLARNMDSVQVAEWDDGNMRAICSGGGYVLDAKGNVIFRLGEEAVPHGQEVRVADFCDDYPGPEMVIRWNGHNTDVHRAIARYSGWYTSRKYCSYV